MMSKIGDARESVVLEKERIDKDLQQMGESLQSLKSSVEKDATLLQKSDFSDLLQHIVTDLSALSQTPDIALLQETLQSQENLTVLDLDKIIQQFISVKLEYTANKSLHLTDTSLEKYKQLTEHKSAMDALLLKIIQTSTVENPPADVQDKEKTSESTTNSEIIAPVPETLNPEVIKAQESLTDGLKNPPISPETQKDDTKEEEKKSFWERAKESSFGLAYIFGAENMTTFKDWVGEKWDDLKEWIGWKKKNDKEESNIAPTTPESSATSPESTQSSIDINKNLTEEERLLRNAHIKQSIIDTTTVPVPIDYKTDKDLLLQKGSPDKISFDIDTQSIILGGAKVQLKFPQFTMDVGGIDATVTKVDIRSIKASGNDFVIEAKGTGSAGFIEQTKDISTTLSKEQFYGLLQPYLESGKIDYDTSLEFDGNKVPLKLNIAGSIEPKNTPSGDESSENFISYKQQIYNEYPEQEKKYLDDISKYSTDMYTQAATGLDKGRLPTLLQEYDASLLSGLDGGMLAILGKQFATVSDLVDDTALQKLGNMANDVLGTIVDFLSKGEDTPIIKRIAKILKRPFEKLQGLIPNGNEQKQNDLRSTIEKQLKEDPSIKADLERVVKQFSLVRFYFTEKKAMLQEKGTEISSFEKLSLPAAADLLQKQSLLDASISKKMTLGLESNKVSVVLEELIKSTNPGLDLSEKRGKIIFNYKTNELESRGMGTKINVSKDGKRYQIEGLDMAFTDLKSALWLANLSNRMISQIGGLSAVTSKVEDYFVYEGLVVQQGLYRDSRGLNTDRLVSGGAFKDNIDGWEFDYGVNYAKYLNDRVKLF